MMRTRSPTHHKLVKTTPKPSATKKSKGELVGLPLLEWCVEVGEAVADVDVAVEDVGVDMVATVV